MAVPPPPATPTPPVPTGITGSPLFDLLLENATPVALLLVAILAFARGWVVPGSEHLRVVEKLEKTEQQRDAMRDGLEEKVLPVLVRTLDAFDNLESILEKLETLLERLDAEGRRER